MAERNWQSQPQTPAAQQAESTADPLLQPIDVRTSGFPNSLLTDPVFTVERAGGVMGGSTLPQVLHGLCRDEIVSFPRLRPHQAPAWHAFLVQLAAIAADADTQNTQKKNTQKKNTQTKNTQTKNTKTKNTRRPAALQWTAAQWLACLRNLTAAAGGDDAWKLLAAADRPAFLQPPAADGLHDYRSPAHTPDVLDILVVAKNHDVKHMRRDSVTAEDWAFALISLQTQEGVMGAGKYGVARMNGGYGNRTYVNWVRQRGGPGAAFRRDLSLLLNTVNNAAAASRAQRPGLLWLQPWAFAEQQFQLDELHPLFIEVCRRVRLVRMGGDNTPAAAVGTSVKLAEIMALQACSAGTRVHAAHHRGVVGDPWMPVQRPGAGAADHARALSITAEGFSFRRVVELLFGSERRSYELPLLARPAAAEAAQTMQVTFTGLCRGQGKTHGFHQRSMAVPAAVVRVLCDPASESFACLAQMARNRVELVSQVQGKCLRPALISLFQKGPKEPDWNKPCSDQLVSSWLAHMDHLLEADFFDNLWAEFLSRPLSRPAFQQERGEADPEHLWLLSVQGLACRMLTLAAEAAPACHERLLLADACAWNILEGAFFKNFAQLPSVQTPAA